MTWSFKIFFRRWWLFFSHYVKCPNFVCCCSCFFCAMGFSRIHCSWCSERGGRLNCDVCSGPFSIFFELLTLTLIIVFLIVISYLLSFGFGFNSWCRFNDDRRQLTLVSVALIISFFWMLGYWFEGRKNWKWIFYDF